VVSRNVLDVAAMPLDDYVTGRKKYFLSKIINYEKYHYFYIKWSDKKAEI
jgi:hypothetical protein